MPINLLRHNSKLKFKLNNNKLKKLDFVYTFVDCEDSKFRNTYIKYKNNIDLTRFKNYNEIYFSLNTLEFFTEQLVNNIYIVTFNQHLNPTLLSDWAKSKIKYIFHSDIIPEIFLPTFNSIVIESFLHRIPNLTNDFVYLNDEFFLGNILSIKDIYKSNYPCVYINKNYKRSIKNNKQPWLNYYLNAYKLFETKFPNILVDFKASHCPYIMNINVCNKTWNLFGNEYINTLVKFRDNSSINFIFLSYMVGLYYGNYKYRLVSPDISIYFHCDTSDLDCLINTTIDIFEKKPLFFNINNLNDKTLPILLLFKKYYIKLFNCNKRK